MINIYTSPMGSFQDSNTYQHIATFSNPGVANEYVSYMRGQRRYSRLDIVVTENDDKNPTCGAVRAVISVTGECLPVEEYTFR